MQRLHIEARHHLLHAAGDVSIADEPERAMGDVPVHALDLAPFVPRLGAGVVLRNLAYVADKERDGMFGNALGD